MAFAPLRSTFALTIAQFKLFSESRHSVWRYTCEVIPGAVLEQGLDCALSAPWPYNRQPALLTYRP